MRRFATCLLRARASQLAVVATLAVAMPLRAVKAPASEQAPEPVTTADGVQTILDDYVQALGGRAALDRLRTRRVEGRVDIPNRESPSAFEAFWEAPNHGWLRIFDPEAPARSSGFNGRTGWREGSSEWGTYEVMSAVGIHDLLLTVDPLRFANLSEVYPSVVREVPAPGAATAQILRATTKSVILRCFFDPNSHLLTEIDEQAVPETSWRRYLFSDYRRVDGIKFPHLIHEIVPIPNVDPASARIESTLHFKKIVHNVAVPGEIFSPAPGLIPVSAKQGP
jgi:hypothetical protein